MRIAFIQNENYGSALKNGELGDTANHHAAALLNKLSDEVELLAVCTTSGDTAYETAVNETVIEACVPEKESGAVDHTMLIDLLIKWRVNYLVLQIPSRPVLAWAMKQNIRTLPLFSNGVEINSLSKRIGAMRMKRLLNHSRIPIVGVRNNSSGAVYKKIGVKTQKIFPFHWNENDNADPYITNCDLNWTTLVQRWIDSPRRPAQSIMDKSLKERLQR